MLQFHRLLIFLLQMFILDSNQLPATYIEGGSGRESGSTNQSDVEVVNSSQLLNMLKSCSGCLVTIKNPMHNTDPKNDTGRTLQEQTPNSTVDGLYMTNQTKTGVEKTHENDTMLLFTSPSLNQSQVSSSVSELGDMLRKCEGCYVDNNYSKKKSRTHARHHHSEDQQEQGGEEAKKENKHKKVKVATTEDFEMTTVDQAIQPPETPEVPANIPYGESELSGVNEVPQLDNRNDTRDTPGDLVFAVENLSDEELGKTTEPISDIRKRNGEKHVSFNYTDVTQERENERIRSEEESFVNTNSNNNTPEEHFGQQQQHEEEKKHTDGKKKKRSKCKGKQTSCSEKHGGSQRASMKEQKSLNNSIAQAEAVVEQLKNLTDNFSETNLTTSFGDQDEMKEEFTRQRAEVEPAELRSMIQRNDVRLIDLRENWELTHEGRISKAINIPRT